LHRSPPPADRPVALLNYIIYREPPFSHHLLEVAIGERVAAVPADAQEDDGRLEVPPLERGLRMLHEYDSGRAVDELTSGLWPRSDCCNTTSTPSSAAPTTTCSARELMFGAWASAGVPDQDEVEHGLLDAVEL
jgi:hypothetical protein